MKKILFLFFLLLIPVLISAQWDINCLAVWTLDNTKADDTGNGYTLVDVGTGGAFQTDHVLSGYGYGHSFSATTGNTEQIPSALQTVLNGLNYWTYEAWVYTPLDPIPATYFTGMYNYISKDYNQMIILNNSTNLQVYYNSIAGGGSGIFPSAGWYLWSMQYDSTTAGGTFKLYINGTQEIGFTGVNNQLGISGSQWPLLCEYNLIPNTGSRMNKAIISNILRNGVETTPIINTPTFTDTPTFTPTFTWTPTFTDTPTFTNTPIASGTFTATATMDIRLVNTIIAIQTYQAACGCFYAIESQSPTPSCTVSATTNPTDAYWFTPTPFATPMMCNTPWQVNSFVQNQTPVLVPTYTYEGGINGSVVEPYIIYCAYDGLLHMTYTGDAFYLNGNEAICLATSPDGDNWTRQGCIIGNGFGGDNNACGQSSQLFINNEYRIYFTDELNKFVYYMTSIDGINYTLVGYPYSPVVQTSTFEPPCSGSGGQSDGIGIFPGLNGTLYALNEIIGTGCPQNVPYTIYLTKDTSGNATSFSNTSLYDLDDLRYWMRNHSYPLGSNGGITQGGKATLYYNGIWYSWYGVGYPTDIYTAESNDLYNWWAPSTSPVIQHTGNMFGLIYCNQAADASIIEWHGALYLFYDVTDNTLGRARIGYSKCNMTLAQYASCGLLTSTPTGTPTATPTYTITPNMTLTVGVQETETAVINGYATAQAQFTQTAVAQLTATQIAAGYTATPNLSATKTPTANGSAYVVGATKTVTFTITSTLTFTPVYSPTKTPTITPIVSPAATRTPYIISYEIKQ